MAAPETDLAQPKTPSAYAWTQLKLKVQQQKAARAFELFRAAGIEPILIKGLAAARHYPDDVLRDSVDMDIAVAAADFRRAENLTKTSEFEGLAVDVHRELRHLDTVDWEVLFARSELVDTPFGRLRMLAAEDHLRILCVHWLLDGGTNRPRLWDIYYLVKNRDVDFDWDRFLNSVSPRRRRWLVCTLGLASKYLGLDLSNTPIADEAKHLPAWLINTVEREWASTVKDTPMEVAIHRPETLIKIVRKKIPPNPIWATIQMEGSFDARTRVFYQIGNVFQRIPSSIRRLSRELLPNRR